MDIQVIDIRLLLGHKATRAFCDIRLNEIVVRDFRVMQNGGKPYIRAPFSTYKNQHGELCFRQIVDLPEEVRGQVDNLVLSAFYREKERENGRPEK